MSRFASAGRKAPALPSPARASAGKRAALTLAAAGALLPARDAAAQLYLQLDSGWSWAQNAGMTNAEPSNPGCAIQGGTPSAHYCDGSLNHLGSSLIIGGGIGYRLPRGFRVDVTYDNRSGYDLSGTAPIGTTFDPKVTANTVMLNGYYDIPYTIAERVRPYVGGGIGWSRNKVNNITYSEPGASGQIPGGSWTGPAWQLTLGADVRIADHWVLDIGYRYSDLGKLTTNAGPATSGEPFNAANFTTPLEGKLKANEVLFNFRYEF